MSILEQTKKRCPCCLHKWIVPEVVSTNKFGSMDLDTRPPRMARDTIGSWVHECPNCGYVIGGIGSFLATGNATGFAIGTKVTKSFLKSEQYHSCEGYCFNSDITALFYRRYMIMKRNNNIH